MNKDKMLKQIAESGYNVGYAAKKHLATFDMIEKGPGWLGLISLAIGVYALIWPPLTDVRLSAALVIFAVVSLYMSQYNSDKPKYELAGQNLTKGFHALRSLYYEVESDQGHTAWDSKRYQERHDQLLAQANNAGISKQMFLSDWYAHYKFFWQMQIDWIDEQLKFTLFRDRLPLSFTVTVIAFFIAIAVAIYHRDIYALCSMELKK